MSKNKTFHFFVPIDDIKKGGVDKEGKPVMKVSGICSTPHFDTDNESLSPSGFDLSYFKNKGLVNYNHQSKNDPSSIIGEPTKAEIRKEGMYVEAMLYPDSEKAIETYKAIQVLSKNSPTRRMGFSIEGKVIERSKDNPQIVNKAMITGLAITPCPKNHKTLVDIMKGDFVEDEELIVETTEDAVKSLNAETTGVPLKREDLEGAPHVTTYSDDEDDDDDDKKEDKDDKKDKDKKKQITKAELYELIFDSKPVIDFTEANKIIKIANKINPDMLKNKQTAQETLQKAEEVLELLDTEFSKRTISKSDDTAEDEEMDEQDEDANGGKTENTGDEGKGKGGNKTESMEGVSKEKSLSNDNLIFKSLIETSKTLLNEVRSLQTKVDGQSIELVKANEEIGELTEKLNQPLERKSVTSVRERFNKSNDEPSHRGSRVLHSKNDKRQILELLDEATFAKGLDVDYANALSNYESMGTIGMDVRQRIAKERNVMIVDA